MHYVINARNNFCLALAALLSFETYTGEMEKEMPATLNFNTLYGKKLGEVIEATLLNNENREAFDQALEAFTQRNTEKGASTYLTLASRLLEIVKDENRSKELKDLAAKRAASYLIKSLIAGNHSARTTFEVNCPIALQHRLNNLINDMLKNPSLLTNHAIQLLESTAREHWVRH